MKLSQLVSRFLKEFFPGRDEFDRAHGTDTAGYVSLFRLRIASPNKKLGVRYEPCNPQTFHEAVQGIERSRTFIDIGCGKGRALILAHEEGFRKIIGVEFSARLASVARRQCPFARIVVGDAAKYVFPNEPTCAFLYNPFGQEVLNQTLAHLPNDSIVVYANPLHCVNLPVIRSGRSFVVYGDAQ